MSEDAQKSDKSVRPRGRPRHTEPSPEYLLRLEEIIDTAAEIFHVKGYVAGSLDDVAAALDLRKASLYHYVGSKGELLYLIFDRAMSLALKGLDELVAIDDPAERLASFISHRVLTIAEERNLFSVFFENRPRLNEDYEDRVSAKEQDYFRHFVDAVSLASNSGVIPNIDPRIGAQALLGMTSWVYQWFEPEEDNAAELAMDFVELIFRTRLPVNTVYPGNQSLRGRSPFHRVADIL